jgi:dihydrodipicolinate synthase/N-acetylneuraminate lyase
MFEGLSVAMVTPFRGARWIATRPRVWWIT